MPASLPQLCFSPSLCRRQGSILRTQLSRFPKHHTQLNIHTTCTRIAAEETLFVDKLIFTLTTSAQSLQVCLPGFHALNDMIANQNYQEVTKIFEQTNRLKQ